MHEHPKLSYECRHQLSEWVRLYCPCATEDSEFLRGLLIIVEREIIAIRSTIAKGSDQKTERDGGAE